MELNYFKDILFDLINEWDEDVQDVMANDKENILRVVMRDGSVFRLHCEKEPFHLLRPPESV